MEEKIFYQTFGNGKKIVFLHGWGRSGEDFSFLSDVSFPGQAIIFDLPGFGQSNVDEKLISPEDYAGAIFSTLKKENLIPDIIVGHSYGGKLAFLLGQKYPQCNLLLLSPSLIKPRFNLKRFWKIKTYKIKKKIYKFFGKELKQGSKDYQNAQGHMRKVLVSAVNNYYGNKLATFGGKIVLMWGKNDQATPIYMANKIKKKSRDCTLVTIEGDHFAFLDNKYLLIKKIKELL